MWEDLWGYGKESIVVWMISVLIVHLGHPKLLQWHWLTTAALIYMVFGVLTAAIIGYAISVQSQTTDVYVLLVAVFMVGTSVFIIVGELMYLGLGSWLTKKWGDKWVKEIDYFYLLLGAAGIAASVNRLQVVNIGSPQ